MAAKDTVRRNKTAIQLTLCADYKLILNKVFEKGLITEREYNNLKSINREDVEGHVTELVDKMINKGEGTCQGFLNLLQTDEDIRDTYPNLENIWNDNTPLSKPVQASSVDNTDSSPDAKKQKDEQYQLNSKPTGLCVIINNEHFTQLSNRTGTNKDAESLGKVFSWLGFRVLMCKDQTKDQMDQALNYFTTLSDPSQLPEFSVNEWTDGGFTDLQEAPKHGDAFICCILSHGVNGTVSGTDGEPLSINAIYKRFRATDRSALTGKPKMFLFQAPQRGAVRLSDLQSDDCRSQSNPEEDDFLVATATVEGYESYRHRKDGSWFIQSVCQQLEEGCPRFSMAAKDTVRRNKTAIQSTLCADYKLILNKVSEKKLITQREYNNLKSINREDVEGHVTELVDKMINKGEGTCQGFLNLLQTDEDIRDTYPNLENIWNDNRPLSKPVQASSVDNTDSSPDPKRQKKDEQYQLNSKPTGLCVIINNEHFTRLSNRTGTNKDAESLGKVFSWLGFRVLMCKDQTKDQMDQALNYFTTLSDPSQLPEFSVKEWADGGFTDLQEAPKHGDAFICCILSHGVNGTVSGTDGEPLSIKEIHKRFKATDRSALNGKPKVFLIQACQGKGVHRGVLLKDLQSDDCRSQSIPEEADFLVATATIEDYVSYRHPINGTWFIQSVCQQLEEGCPRGDDMITILRRVNNEVSQKEAGSTPGEKKQMPEVTFALRKRLVLLPPHCN
ncbi:Caspase-8 [Nibea albiflora]|uniref:Caspase-8 n=1 Tax=Nibea albiflora TaxID=240163 RepID=A0ACB7FHD8_NIBAL|nr:Caspase-8 [Nibea albiflora]